MSVAEATKTEWRIGSEAFPELHEEVQARTARLLGGVIVGNIVEQEPVIETQDERKQKTLGQALVGTLQGDSVDNQIVDLCIDTEVAERLFNAGHQTRIPLTVDEDNELSQNGVKVTEVSINTLRHAGYEGIMEDRAKSELHNGVFFNVLHQNDILEDHVAVVWSHTPTNKKVKKDYNFFDDDSVAIQVLKKEGNGYVYETAFVAGVHSDSDERFDLDAVKMLALEHGVDVMSHDTETMLSQVMIIPKEQLQLGVTTLVQQYDNVLGGTFYGEDKPVQDYEQFAKTCLERDFSAITRKIKHKLLSEAPHFKNPMDAVERLDYWSRKFCMEQAVADPTIDSRAFGAVASGYVEKARVEYMRGNLYEATKLTNLAKENDQSGSCPIKNNKTDRGLEGELSNLFEIESSTEPDNESGGEKEMTCPFCKEKTKGDPCADSITCTNCSASTKHSEEENKRRADQYKEVKRMKIAPEMEVKNLFDEIIKTSFGRDNDED